MQASTDKLPGPGEHPNEEDLTETEAAIIYALRLARRCEGSWTEYYRREAWELIQQATKAQETGRAKEANYLPLFTPGSPASELLEAAAIANAEAIAFLVANRGGRDCE